MAKLRTTKTYLGVADIAKSFGVEPATVTKWMNRYDDWPVPDVQITPGRGGVPDRGWALQRLTEWQAWKKSLPGQGAAGFPKPRRAKVPA